MNPAEQPADQSIAFTPIGWVAGEFAGYAPSEEMRERPSRIVLRPELASGLMGLEAGQYLLVLFHLHQAVEYELQLHPGHNPVNPLRGVFATRSQYRPNGIGATVAQILAVADNTVTVTGLDAQDGSPVLDLKPYSAGFDSPPDVPAASSENLTE